MHRWTVQIIKSPLRVQLVRDKWMTSDLRYKFEHRHLGNRDLHDYYEVNMEQSVLYLKKQYPSQMSGVLSFSLCVWPHVV